jgi:23S rRNA pseudouridine1911/1915/1917 synthase
MELEILHHDNHLLVVVKPPCLPIVPDESGDESLLDLARAWVKREYDKPGEVFLGVVHRLDRPVSGVVVFARTSKAARRLTEQFRNRTVHKVYLGVGIGTPKDRAGTLRVWLRKDRSRNVVESRKGPFADAKPAVTHWRVLLREGRGAGARVLYELIPETGRSHQLRLAAASLGTPLLGDLKYGASDPLSDRSVALHATSLEIEHPTRKVPFRFRTPPPDRGWWNFAGASDLPGLLEKP